MVAAILTFFAGLEAFLNFCAGERAPLKLADYCRCFRLVFVDQICGT